MSLAITSSRPPKLSGRSLRLFHATCKRKHLVAPPDPVSHMRPIIYEDAAPPAAPSLVRHPYSLREFDDDSQNSSRRHELQFKLQRRQLDDFHHSFWFDSNTRFEAAKKAVLEGLPSSSTPYDQEKALSEFYKQWYMQESSRLKVYTDEWRRRNASLIKLDMRVKYDRLFDTITSIFSSRK